MNLPPSSWLEKPSSPSWSRRVPCRDQQQYRSPSCKPCLCQALFASRRPCPGAATIVLTQLARSAEALPGSSSPPETDFFRAESAIPVLRGSRICAGEAAAAAPVHPKSALYIHFPLELVTPQTHCEFTKRRTDRGRPKTNLLLWHHFKVDPAQATGTGPAGGRAIDQVGERRGGLAGCWARRCEAKGLGVGRTRSAAPGGSLTDQGEFHRNEGWRGFVVLREGCSRAREGHEKKKKQEQQPQRAKLESAFPALSAGGEAERPMVDPAPQPLANGASRELLLTFSLLSLSSFPCLRSKRTRSFFRPRPTTTHACRLAHVTRRRRRSDVRVCERGRAAHHGRVIR